MGKEQLSPYYDAIYSKSEEYKKHWKESRYLKLWQAVKEQLNIDYKVIDIGCGPGQFANMLAETGFGNYLGIDFSKQAIKQAREINKLHLEKFRFECLDIYKYDFFSEKDAQFVIMETMEHIEKDVEFLVSLKTHNQGKKVIITVPTFDDPSHVRYYKTAKEWKARFDSFIDIKETKTIGPWIIIIAEL